MKKPRCQNCTMVEKMYFDAKANNDDQVKAIREWQAKSAACEKHCAALESEITEVRGLLALSRDEVVKLRRDLDLKDHEVAALRGGGE